MVKVAHYTSEFAPQAGNLVGWSCSSGIKKDKNKEKERVRMDPWKQREGLDVVSESRSVSRGLCQAGAAGSKRPSNQPTAELPLIASLSSSPCARPSLEQHTGERASLAATGTDDQQTNINNAPTNTKTGDENLRASFKKERRKESRLSQDEKPP